MVFYHKVKFLHRVDHLYFSISACLGSLAVHALALAVHQLKLHQPPYHLLVVLMELLMMLTQTAVSTVVVACFAALMEQTIFTAAKTVKTIQLALLQQ